MERSSKLDSGEGRKSTGEGAEESGMETTREYGIRFRTFNRKNQPTVHEQWFKSTEARLKFYDALIERDNFLDVLAWCD